VSTTYATTADLVAKAPNLTAAQRATGAVHLEEGSALLRQLVPGLDAGLTAGTVDPVMVRKVLTDAVLRVLRNPSGVTTQVVGPESATFSGLAARAELGFTPAEVAAVTPAPEEPSVGGSLVGSARLGLPYQWGQWAPSLPPGAECGPWRGL
jgi:hypothetical protein